MNQNASTDTDSLVRRAAAGDPLARSAVLDRFRDRLRRMVAIRLDRRLAARVDPSDVVQEAMRVACERMPGYLAAPTVAFYPWLRQIAWDRLMDTYRTHIKAERRTVLREKHWSCHVTDESVHELVDRLMSDSLRPNSRIIEVEMKARMISALETLKPQDREILVLRYLEQLDVAEISQVLEITPTAVTSRHLRALQRIRRILKDSPER